MDGIFWSGQEFHFHLQNSGQDSRLEYTLLLLEIYSLDLNFKLNNQILSAGNLFKTINILIYKIDYFCGIFINRIGLYGPYRVGILIFLPQFRMGLSWNYFTY